MKEFLTTAFDFYREHQTYAELVLWGVGTLIAMWLGKRLLDWAANAKTKQQSSKAAQIRFAVLDTIRVPVQWMIMGYALAALLGLLGKYFPELDLADQLGMVRRAILLSAIAWGGVRMIRSFEFYWLNSDRTRTAEAKIRALSKLARVLIIMLFAMVVMQQLGFSVSGILAFGGIGGIAIGFAAKDLLANFFGGAMIYLDRPFTIGDWIRSPDRDIEGIVEEIGWRLTRIRTFDKRPIYVPNAVFANIVVENPSRMMNRRIYETIGVRYQDMEKMPKLIQSIESMLKNHKDIDQNQLIMVNFNRFGAHSLDFFIYCFTKTTHWQTFHQVKQDVMFQLYQVVVNHQAEMAFPTQSLHIESIADFPISAEALTPEPIKE